MTVVFVAAAVLGLLPAVIAKDKGRSFVVWWLYGAALFIFALPHALLLTPGEGYGSRKCPYCAELIKREAKVCRYCGRDLPPLVPHLTEPVKQYHLAAEQGDADAQNTLGEAFAKGRGAPKDYGEAVKWFCLAAEHGHAEAQNNLGLMYANGAGVTRDDAEAVKWFRRSAEQGHVGAKANLDVMTRERRGVSR